MKLKSVIISCIFALIVSSTAKENLYLDGGIPASSRDWQGADYITTYKAIQSGKVPLPLIKDKLGKPIIERIVNLANLSFNRNLKLPLKSRFPDYLQLQEGSNAILRLYLIEANKGAKLNNEIATLASFNLHVSALGIDLLNEFIPTIPKDDSYKIRMQGIKKMYNGLVTQVVGMEASLSETTFYTNDDISIMLNAMNQTLPKIKQAFPPEYKTELKTKLVGRRVQLKDNDLKLLNEMIQELNK